VNGEPLDPVTTAEHVADLRAPAAPELFAGFDPDHFPPTSLPALAVATAAYRRNDRIGEAVSLALRVRSSGKAATSPVPTLLARIAETHRVGAVGPDDDRALLAEWRDGQSRAVKRSPHFVCGEGEVFCPSLDISKDEAGQLQVRRNIESLDVFLAK
jgi:hypothetical protein